MANRGEPGFRQCGKTTLLGLELAWADANKVLTDHGWWEAIWTTYPVTTIVFDLILSSMVDFATAHLKENVV
jgi:hypothetical protein